MRNGINVGVVSEYEESRIQEGFLEEVDQVVVQNVSERTEILMRKMMVWVALLHMGMMFSSRSTDTCTSPKDSLSPQSYRCLNTCALHTQAHRHVCL